MAPPKSKKTTRKEKAAPLCGRCGIVLAAAPASLKVGRGRTPDLTRPMLQRLAASLARGTPKRKAAASLGISRSTLYEWDARGRADKTAGVISLYAEFSDTLWVAQAVGEDGQWAAVEAGISTGEPRDVARGKLALAAIALRKGNGKAGAGVESAGGEAAPAVPAPARRFDFSRLDPVEQVEFRRLYAKALAEEPTGVTGAPRS
jgi:hypothetical protein